MPTTRTDRERRHQARLDSINRVQCVVGSADRTRIDHEGTLLERARLLEQELRSYAASEAGLLAFERLLAIAEEGRGAQGRHVRGFLQALRDRQVLPIAVLRTVDADIADDMLAVLDAWRFARLDLVEQVRGGATAPRPEGATMQGFACSPAISPSSSSSRPSGAPPFP